MFTGIIEEMGRVVALTHGERSATVTVSSSIVHADARLGDSIAVNGCCLTVVEIADNRLTFEAIPETLERTNLGALRADDSVNLERSLAIGGRLGGHFVQGHIDGSGEILALTSDDNALVFEIGIPDTLRRYFVEKGSVAVDGVSLTVASVLPHGFTIWTIPHTRAVTTLGSRKVGDSVNIECDLLGKYIERLISERFDKV